MKPKQPLNSSATLLVGFDPRTALAVARSLHRQGIRVVVATIADWETALPSRAIAAYVKISNREDPTHFITELLNVLRAENIDTILPITDRALRSLSPHLSELEERYYIQCPSADQLETILDKSKTSALADSLKIPFPATLSVREVQDAGELRSPVFVKLRDKALQDTLVDPCDPAVGLAKNRAELAQFFDTYGEDRLILQEFIKGDDVGLAVLMENGECIRSFQYRALRLYPASGGVCTLAETEQVNPDLLLAAVKMLSRLHWNGLAQIDFRHDRKTGHFALLEINGRFWGSTTVAVKAGADFPCYVYQHLHHALPIRPQPYKVGFKVRWLEGDLRRLIQYYKFCRSSGTRNKFYPELFKVIQSFDPRVSGMFWSWGDPGPSFRAISSVVWYWGLSKARRFRATETAKPSVIHSREQPVEDPGSLNP